MGVRLPFNFHSSQTQLDNFDEDLQEKAMLEKVFDGEMFITTLFTRSFTFLKVIVKYIDDPDGFEPGQW